MNGVFDGHSDLLSDVACRRLKGEHKVLERLHLERLRQGKIEGLILSFWANPEGGKGYGERTRELMLCAREEFRETPWLEVVCRADEAEAAKARGKMYAFLAVEGMAAIGDDPEGVDAYADFGVRMGMLTWNETNLLATGALGDSYSGLTAAGKQVVRRMEQRGMIVDVSHLNCGGFWDVVRIVQGPVMASHSNSRVLCDVPRNLTDEQLRVIRDTGGVVGVNAYHGFVHADPHKQTAQMLARHAARMAEIMGVEHVACGFDFCEFMGPGNEGAEGIESCAHVQNFFYWLERFGMSGSERRMIARENLLRVLQ